MYSSDSIITFRFNMFSLSSAMGFVLLSVYTVSVSSLHHSLPRLYLLCADDHAMGGRTKKIIV